MASLLVEFGLTKFPRVDRDPLFILALVAGVAFWTALAWLGPPRSVASAGWSRSLALTLWQPLVEEFLFRGLLQGQMAQGALGRRALWGFSLANLATSFMFATLHLWQHPPMWAAATFVPSLLFGFFRDRHGSLYPSMLLHIYYNSGYFLTAGFPP